MTDRRALLIEIGTEELPPKSLLDLARAFANGIADGLREADLPPGEPRVYATPRRLAALFDAVPMVQAGGETQRRGPALAAAFDADGKPSKAAEGFARSCGVAVEALQHLHTDRGAWLVYTQRRAGRASTELLPAIIARSLAKLPIPKRMRWGVGEVEFVRPVHWVCVVFGDAPVACPVLGLTAGDSTRGHRFHADRAITVARAVDYPQLLYDQGKVVADFERRRASIATQVADRAQALGGRAVVEEALLDEITALVEWPVAIVGHFEEKYLSVPEEILIATMQDHQKYFPLRDADGKLMPAFIAIANIDSVDAAAVSAGNERVVRPRLADAMFFWRRDRKHTLASRGAALSSVSFQRRLGSLADKTERVIAVAARVATDIGADPVATRRAAALAKCDLLTDMVGEFPALQGVMGAHYARCDGEPEAVAVALREQYLPRFAGDALAISDVGSTLAIAERIDTLVGFFATGCKPSGEKDPFGLRRAALGLLRTLIEGRRDIDLRALIDHGAAQFHPQLKAPASAAELFEFMLDRLKTYYADRGVTAQILDAVTAVEPTAPLDFDRRIRAVQAFLALPEAVSLTASNKRIRNILKKSTRQSLPAIQTTLLQAAAERTLHADIAAHSARAATLLAAADYTEALRVLSGLRTSVDAFFDSVMVMVDDRSVRNNRLALLRELASLFTQVADISRLSGT